MTGFSFLFKKVLAVLLLTMLLLNSPSPFAVSAGAGADPTYYETISTNSGEIQKSEFVSKDKREMFYRYPNEDLFYQQRAFKQGSSSFFIPGEKAFLRYYDNGKKDWVVSSVSPQGQSYSHMIHLIVDEKECILSVPYAWKPIANRSLENIPSENGKIQISKEETGVRILFSWSKPQTAKYTDFFMLSSQERLIDWENPTISRIWKGYQFCEEGRWCYSGFFFPSPSTYEPSGKNIYNLNPAAYTPSHFIQTGGSRAADDLGIAMMDIMSNNYGSTPYIPSYAKSKWLFNDYNLAGGYFDDRFNTDIAMAYFVAYQKFGIEKFKEIYLRYGDFLVQYAAKYRYPVKGNGRTGLMLQDYWHPSGNKGTHCALNHQLAVILFLYKTGEGKYKKTAEDLLWGIKITRDGWIKKDGDLHYAFLSNGKFGMKDYPYLTYNDLYRLQTWLTAYYGKEDPDLKFLMDIKEKWMKSQEIDQYLGYGKS